MAECVHALANGMTGRYEATVEAPAMEEEKHRESVLAIVGMGASGLALLIQLRGATASGRLRVLAFERRAACGPGVAWSCDTPEELLSNTRAGDVHVSHLLPTYAEWAGVCAASYPPRRAVGEYLVALANAEVLRPGVERVQTEVVAVEAAERASSDEGGAPVVVLVDAEGRRWPCDGVVLCVGGGCGAHAGAVAGAAFHFVDPATGAWTPAPSNATVKGARVAVDGTGLSAVDAARWLLARGAQHVLLRSRRGRLPVVQ